MLRIHFTPADLCRVRVARAPDPLWEVCTSLHRMQLRRGRWAYAEWYRSARVRLEEAGLTRTVQRMLLPLFPRAEYFPDFLTPPAAAEGLDAGLEAVLAASPRRVLAETARLAGTTAGAPRWAPRLAEREPRERLVEAIRGYYDTVIRPYADTIQARIEAERARHARHVLDEGADGLLGRLGPMLRWESPVLHARYPHDRDLRLEGRGLTLVPSYFCWGNPVALTDPSLAPVLMYGLRHEPDAGSLPARLSGGAPLAVLVGRTRAQVLRVIASGATTGELARALAVSASSASQHAGALRDAGLVVSHRHGTSVLHTLTPLGAALLRASSGPPPSD